MMHGTLRVAAGLVAAGVVGAVPAAASPSARPTAKVSKSSKARPPGLSYVAATPEGGVSIAVSRDRREVRRTLFAYAAKCTDGSTSTDWDVLTSIPIAADRSFKSGGDSGPVSSPRFPGVTVQLTDSISGLISKSGAKIVGTASFTIAITKDGQTIKCDTGMVPFTATD